MHVMLCEHFGIAQDDRITVIDCVFNLERKIEYLVSSLETIARADSLKECQGVAAQSLDRLSHMKPHATFHMSDQEYSAIFKSTLGTLQH
jgi:hypothetical protein